MARPKKDIDADQVYKLTELGCTINEIAAYFGCHRETISERFSTEISCARASWKMSIRRAQTRRAVKDRSDAMLIHLGRVYLGQVAKDATPPVTMEVLGQLESIVDGDNKTASGGGDS